MLVKDLIEYNLVHRLHVCTILIYKRFVLTTRIMKMRNISKDMYDLALMLLTIGNDMYYGMHHYNSLNE